MEGEIATQSQSLDSRLRVPPFGFLPEGWQKLALKRAPTAAWPGSEKEWADFLDEARILIRDTVWPVWSREANDWEGGAARDILELTRVDLKAIQMARSMYWKQPAWDADLAGMPHRRLFKLEDNDSWDRSVLCYCSSLAGYKDELLAILTDVWEERAATVIQALKWTFQRPRPHQMAFILGISEFPWGYAQSSLSPSLVSGHALQGCIAGALLQSRLQAFDPALAARCKSGVQRWAMDIGDRRVFAGVHYPTDNVASWLVALRLAPRVVGSGAGEFLEEGIQQQSLVYRLLKKECADEPAMASRLAVLDAELGGTTGTPARGSSRSGKSAGP